MEAESIMQQTRREEERVAGKDREKDSRFDENNAEGPPQDPGTHREEEAFRIVEPAQERLKPRRVSHGGEGLEDHAVSLCRRLERLHTPRPSPSVRQYPRNPRASPHSSRSLSPSEPRGSRGL